MQITESGMKQQTSVIKAANFNNIVFSPLTIQGEPKLQNNFAPVPKITDKTLNV